MDTLEKLLGSAAKVRLLRLFIANPGEVFENKEIADRIHISANGFKTEFRLLLDLKFLRRASKIVTVEDAKGRIKKIRREGYQLAKDFPYLKELAELFASHTPHVRERLLAGLQSSGQVDLVVIAGGLLGHSRDQVDVFIVGEALKKNKIENLLKSIEVGIGREIVYAFMTTKEFTYRFGLFDRFLKSLFDNPHEILLDRIGIPVPDKTVRIREFSSGSVWDNL